MSDFRPITPHDVTDLALLPKRFDMLAGEMREQIAALSVKLITVLERVEEKLDDLNHRVSQLEKDQHRTDKRLAEVERAISRRKAKK